MAANGKRWQSMWKWVGWVAAVIYLGVVIYLGWRGPYLLARRHANTSVQSAYISAGATVLGVAATAVVAIVAIWFARSTNKATMEAARETNEATIDAAREAQFPERYSRAIEQLGFDNRDVRIGGIYALERIARDSLRDHPTVIEVLSAFVREHSHDPWEPELPPDAIDYGRLIPPDVQAALTVIGRRDTDRDRGLIDLRGANLPSAILDGAKLHGADLTDVNLTGALLSRADLSQVFIFGTNFTGANFDGADLTDALLASANLTGATFNDANLTGASWPDGTEVPRGWQRDASNSGRLKRAEPDADGAAPS